MIIQIEDKQTGDITVVYGVDEYEQHTPDVEATDGCGHPTVELTLTSDPTDAHNQTITVDGKLILVVEESAEQLPRVVEGMKCHIEQSKFDTVKMALSPKFEATHRGYTELAHDSEVNTECVEIIGGQRLVDTPTPTPA